MTNEWICSECGMKSTRHWNVMRHILKQHDGRGQPLEIMDYMLRVKAATAPYPSYQNPSGSTKKMRPSDILIQHSFDKIKDTVLDLSRLKIRVKIIRLRADVCDVCLTHRLFWQVRLVGEINSLEQLGHRCDMKWILDYPMDTERRKAAVAVLKERTPEYLARTMKELSDPPHTLISMRDYPTKQIESPNQLVLDRLLQARRTLENDYLIDSLQDAESSNKTDRPRFIKISAGIDRFEWLGRACGKGKTHLSDDEMVAFFSISHSTNATVEFQGQNYWLSLLIQ